MKHAGRHQNDVRVHSERAPDWSASAAAQTAEPAAEEAYLHEAKGTFRLVQVRLLRGGLGRLGRGRRRPVRRAFAVDANVILMLPCVFHS